jgi:hypothetical protein
MKMHNTVIEHLLNIYDRYGGYRENSRLRDRLAEVDLGTYQQQTGEQQQFLVLSEDLNKKQ